MIKEIKSYVFVLNPVENIHPTLFLATDNDFTENIEEAMKAINSRTAKEVKRVYEDEWDEGKFVSKRWGRVSRDLNIVPLTVTYRW